MGLHHGKNTVTYFLVNKTVQSASHMGPTPTSVLVKYVMMHPAVGKYTDYCMIVSVAVADDLSTCKVDAPTLICGALVLGVPCGADGEM